MAENIRKKIQLYRTYQLGVVANDIDVGEIALNYNSYSPFLMFKDDVNNIQKIGALSNTTGSSEYHTMSQKSITNAINDKFDSIEIPEVALSESYEEISYPEISDSVIFNHSLKGDSLDTAVNKLDSNISLLVSEVLKDEKVMAAAFTEIKENVGLDENLKYVSDESANFISGATTLAEADSLLDAAIEEVRSSASLKGHTHTFENITDKPTTLGGYGIVDAKIEGKTITLGDNSLDVSEAVLSESYVSVVYDSDTGDKTFTPAVAKQTLDEAIYAVESNVSTLVTSVLENEEVTSAAITEVKVSVGLDENLKYVTNSSAAYISSATNVSEALNILDNAVLNVFDNMPDVSVDAYTKSESDSKYALKTALDTANQTINSLQNTVSNLQTTVASNEKLDKVISAVGLNNDGTFIVPTTAQTSGYTTAATSVMDAIIILDNQIEENETVAAYALTDLNNKLEEQQNKINELESNLSYYSGHNAISSLTSLPITKRLCMATISSSQTLGIGGQLVDGKEIHVIIKNSSSDTITITIPSSMINMINENLEIEGGKYGEINLVSDGTNIYYKGAS